MLNISSDYPTIKKSDYPLPALSDGSEPRLGLSLLVETWARHFEKGPRDGSSIKIRSTERVRALKPQA